MMCLAKKLKINKTLLRIRRRLEAGVSYCELCTMPMSCCLFTLVQVHKPFRSNMIPTRYVVIRLIFIRLYTHNAPVHCIMILAQYVVILLSCARLYTGNAI